MNWLYLKSFATLLLFTILVNGVQSRSSKTKSNIRRATRRTGNVHRSLKGKHSSPVWRTTKSPTASPTVPPTLQPIVSGNTDGSGAGGGGQFGDFASFEVLKFMLTLEVEPTIRKTIRRLNGEDVTPLEYKDELLDITTTHMKTIGSSKISLESLSLVSQDLRESADGSVITAVFNGSASTSVADVPRIDKQIRWILDSFNEVSQKEDFITDLESAGHVTLTRIIDVTASIVSESNNGSANEEGETVTLVSTSTGFISGMIVGIFILTATFSFIYHRKRQGKSTSKRYMLSDDYKENDDQDEDAHLNRSSWSNSPTKSLGYLAACSARNEINEFMEQIMTSNWNKKKTSMSKLAAGATQEDFALNGAQIDIYGKDTSINKKKKKNSPSMKAKKGAELDTDLDPIVEVSSSVASSVHTDDKAIKSDINVPKLLPALSFSSCPSEELSDCQKIPTSPAAAPALEAMSPDPLLDDMITPYDEHVASKIMANYARDDSDTIEGSPVRKLNFGTVFGNSDVYSDNSSDSGVQDLLNCENRVVLSEDEAVKANLIRFIDDDVQFSNDSLGNKENYDDIKLKALGSENENVDQRLPLRETSDDYNATILVLSSREQSNNCKM